MKYQWQRGAPLSVAALSGQVTSQVTGKLVSEVTGRSSRALTGNASLRPSSPLTDTKAPCDTSPVRDHHQNQNTTPGQLESRPRPRPRPRYLYRALQHVPQAYPHSWLPANAPPPLGRTTTHRARSVFPVLIPECTLLTIIRKLEAHKLRIPLLLTPLAV